MSPKHYDVIVIGAGAGAKISTPSSKLGHKVALCEKGFEVFGEKKTGLGGTCLNRGCIPSKMLIHCADVAQTIEEASRFQVNPMEDADHKHFKVDWETMVKRVEKEIDGDSYSINPRVEANENIDWYQTPAEFVGPKTLKVGDQEITGDKIFIAAGCRPMIPNIEGLKDTPYMTSTEALRLKTQPKKMIVIGGGYIAVELGHFYGALGTEVHMLVRSSMIRVTDSEVANEFTRVFSSKYNTHIGAVPKKVEFDDKTGFKVTVEQNGETRVMEADQLLVCAGVVPNTDDLQVEKAGINLKKGGYIDVDEKLRTNVEGVWAFGDIAGNWLFRHSANFEGEYLFQHVMREKNEWNTPNYEAIDYTGMPYAVFSNPQVAGVGSTEDELKKAGKVEGKDYVKGVNPYRSSAMGSALQSEEGFVKLLIETGSRKILGCHIVGHEASILIHQIIPLMRLGGKLDDVLFMIHIHPALPEITRNAARKARDALMAVESIPPMLELK